MLLTDLPPSLARLVQAIQQHETLNPIEIKKVVVQANIQPEDLAAWEDIEHPAADSYGRKLVYNGGFFEIMVMSWKPGDYSAIHDHGYTSWGRCKYLDRRSMRYLPSMLSPLI